MASELPGVDGLYEQAPCGLMLTQGNGTIERVNRTFCQWLGREPGELIGQRVQNLLTMGGKIFHQTHWSPLLQVRGSVSEVKLELLHADGHQVPMMLNAVRREHNGVFYHELALFVAQERNLYERELLAARTLAEELLQQQLHAQKELTSTQNRLRLAHAEAQIRATFAEQMIGIVSHDLRNPLAAIRMATGLVERGPLEERQRRALNQVGVAVDRAGRLIADLLDFTQARVGQGINVSPAPVDLHSVVGHCLDELRLAFPGRRLSHVQQGSGACNADADRLFQVVGNLVGNAMAYGAPDGEVRVCSAFEPGRVTLTVHNSGEPIPEPLLDHLFEPMVRGVGDDNTRSVGLGLFIVREIMRAHLGDVSVKSCAGQGTTFIATLPRVS